MFTVEGKLFPVYAEEVIVELNFKPDVTGREKTYESQHDSPRFYVSSAL